ncbi:MAG: ribonuclease HII [Candidatus Jorgensenbacteria bacterium]|nr:ribonuclease HII [Candidatus Jorgensenbacteria bacterium]
MRKIKSGKWIIGIDEVGRGALAGPVTVGIFAIHSKNSKLIKSSGLTLRDSKKLSALQREVWVRHMNLWKKEGRDVYFATCSMSHKVVDKINVAEAANKAATRALDKLLIDSAINPNNAKVFLDGGLYIKDKYLIKNRGMARKLPKSETLIKGDENVPVIALASILAKVTRDRKLTKLDAEYPVYKFATHKGYGTKVHIRAIKANGISDIHRLTFTKKWANI